MHVPLWGWALFLVAIVGCFRIDLAFGHRGDQPVTLREAAIWSGIWAAVGLAFTGVVAAVAGAESAGEYLAGFLIEKSLSVDNVFAFAMIFGYFAVPAAAQHRALLYGVLGALVLRGAFIAAGASLLAAFHWTIWVLGAVLVGTGIRMAVHDGGEVHPERNPVLRLLRRVVPMRADYVGDRLWSGRAATPLLGVLVAVATTDVLFAVDSVPAVFAVTRDTFVVFAANAFSVLGLRPMYFLLAGAMERFGKLKYGLSAVLVFVGAKMLLADVLYVSVWVSLLVIAVLLGVSVLASLRNARPISSTPERNGAAMSAPPSTPSPSTTDPAVGGPAPVRGRLQIRFHVSVVVAVGLISVLLGSSVLPRSVPGLSGISYAVAAVLGAALFLASVVAHELAHALLARRNGVPVTGVTLWALGGSTELAGEPATPGAQFRIAGVGPLVSAVIGLVLVALALASSGLLSAVLGWTGVTNGVLAVFNVLPGAPLDGGRLVAAGVWKRTGDRARGTAAAAKAGRLVGLLVLAAGAVEAVLGSVAGGLWLMLIGWFLTATARMEGVRVQVSGALHGLQADAVMTPGAAAPGWLTVETFLERVVQPTRATVFALSAFDGSPAGVVSLPQLTAVPLEQRSAVRTLAVATPISALGTVKPTDLADDLPARMGAGAVLVVADGAVVGLITPNELSRAVALRPPSTKGEVRE